MDTNKSIFVTGGTGFVGSYLLRYLVDRGYNRIRALRRPSSSFGLVAPVADQIEWIEGDVLAGDLLEEALEGVDQVYHCAAMVSFDPRDIDRMMKINVEGTANLVDAALYAGVGKLVHVSSVAALGRIRNGETLSEQNIWQRGRFNTNYAVSKFLSEQEVWRGQAEGLTVGVVNPSIILGSGRWNEGPLKLFRLAWNQFPFYPTGGSGFVDVRDVARLMIRLMESEISGRRFVVSAENMTYGELLGRIARRLGRRPPSVRLSPLVQQLAGYLSWLPARLTGSRPLITLETARNAGRTFFFDNSRSIETFGFQYTPLNATLDIACEQFREASQQDFSSKIMPLDAFSPPNSGSPAE